MSEVHSSFLIQVLRKIFPWNNITSVTRCTRTTVSFFFLINTTFHPVSFDSINTNVNMSRVYSSFSIQLLRKTFPWDNITSKGEVLTNRLRVRAPIKTAQRQRISRFANTRVLVESGMKETMRFASFDYSRFWIFMASSNWQISLGLVRMKIY